jgi:hypothetical protein
VPVSLAAALQVPAEGDSVRVDCSSADAVTAMSVKLIALQVGELG